MDSARSDMFSKVFAASGSSMGNSIHDAADAAARANMNIGVSNSTLLLISITGFTILSWTIYKIILLRFITGDELRKQQLEARRGGGVGDIDADAHRYEHALMQADVATLNRAQRRARARVIGKQQVRLEQQNNNDDDGNDNDNDSDNDNVDDSEHPRLRDGEGDDQRNRDQDDVDDDDDDDNDGGSAAARRRKRRAIPSRKDRQRAAKELERQERRLLHEERQQHQQAAQLASQQAKILRQQVAQDEKRRRTEHAQQQQQHAYQTFLEQPDGVCISVQEWITHCQVTRVVQLQMWADMYHVTVDMVCARIYQLIQEGRLLGILQQRKTPAAEGENIADDCVVRADDKPTEVNSNNEGEDMTRAGIIIMPEGSSDHVEAAATSSATIQTKHWEFVYFSNQELQAIADDIKARGTVTLADVSQIVETQCLGRRNNSINA